MLASLCYTRVVIACDSVKAADLSYKSLRILLAVLVWMMQAYITLKNYKAVCQIKHSILVWRIEVYFQIAKDKIGNFVFIP